MRVISLGAGVQSSAMILASDRGLIPKADFAIFADTQSEPVAVYEWLEFLRSKVSIPVEVVSRGDLASDSVEGIYSERRFSALPTFIKNPDGSEGFGKCQCTADYKIYPIQKRLRQILGYQPGQRIKETVSMLIGISVDEIQRAKPSRERWIKNEHPLIFDLYWRRQKCVEYVEACLGRTPPRSACFMCPFKSDDEWRHLRDTDPDAFALAQDFDESIREQPGFNGLQYLHRSRRPLVEIDFSLPPDDGQLDMFVNECEGMCGV
jgi:hypothetical protein